MPHVPLALPPENAPDHVIILPIIRLKPVAISLITLPKIKELIILNKRGKFLFVKKEAAILTSPRGRGKPAPAVLVSKDHRQIDFTILQNYIPEKASRSARLTALVSEYYAWIFNLKSSHYPKEPTKFNKPSKKPQAEKAPGVLRRRDFNPGQTSYKQSFKCGVLLTSTSYKKAFYSKEKESLPQYVKLSKKSGFGYASFKARFKTFTIARKGFALALPRSLKTKKFNRKKYRFGWSEGKLRWWNKTFKKNKVARLGWDQIQARKQKANVKRILPRTDKGRKEKRKLTKKISWRKRKTTRRRFRVNRALGDTRLHKERKLIWPDPVPTKRSYWHSVKKLVNIFRARGEATGAKTFFHAPAKLISLGSSEKLQLTQEKRELRHLKNILPYYALNYVLKPRKFHTPRDSSGVAFRRPELSELDKLRRVLIKDRRHFKKQGLYRASWAEKDPKKRSALRKRAASKDLLPPKFGDSSWRELERQTGYPATLGYRYPRRTFRSSFVTNRWWQPVATQTTVRHPFSFVKREDQPDSFKYSRERWAYYSSIDFYTSSLQKHRNFKLEPRAESPAFAQLSVKFQEQLLKTFTGTKSLKTKALKKHSLEVKRGDFKAIQAYAAESQPLSPAKSDFKPKTINFLQKTFKSQTKQKVLSSNRYKASLNKALKIRGELWNDEFKQSTILEDRIPLESILLPEPPAIDLHSHIFYSLRKKERGTSFQKWVKRQRVNEKSSLRQLSSFEQEESKDSVISDLIFDRPRFPAVGSRALSYARAIRTHYNKFRRPQFRSINPLSFKLLTGLKFEDKKTIKEQNELMTSHLFKRRQSINLTQTSYLSKNRRILVQKRTLRSITLSRRHASSSKTGRVRGGVKRRFPRSPLRAVKAEKEKVARDLSFSLTGAHKGYRLAVLQAGRKRRLRTSKVLEERKLLRTRQLPSEQVLPIWRQRRDSKRHFEALAAKNNPQSYMRYSRCQVNSWNWKRLTVRATKRSKQARKNRSVSIFGESLLIPSFIFRPDWVSKVSDIKTPARQNYLKEKSSPRKPKRPRKLLRLYRLAVADRRSSWLKFINKWDKNKARFPHFAESSVIETHRLQTISRHLQKTRSLKLPALNKLARWTKHSLGYTGSVWNLQKLPGIEIRFIEKTKIAFARKHGLKLHQKSKNKSRRQTDPRIGTLISAPKRFVKWGKLIWTQEDKKTLALYRSKKKPWGYTEKAVSLKKTEGPITVQVRLISQQARALLPNSINFLSKATTIERSKELLKNDEETQTALIYEAYRYTAEVAESTTSFFPLLRSWLRKGNFGAQVKEDSRPESTIMSVYWSLRFYLGQDHFNMRLEAQDKGRILRPKIEEERFKKSQIRFFDDFELGTIRSRRQDYWITRKDTQLRGGPDFLRYWFPRLHKVFLEDKDRFADIGFSTGEARRVQPNSGLVESWQTLLLFSGQESAFERRIRVEENRSQARAYEGRLITKRRPGAFNSGVAPHKDFKVSSGSFPYLVSNFFKKSFSSGAKSAKSGLLRSLVRERFAFQRRHLPVSESYIAAHRLAKAHSARKAGALTRNRRHRGFEGQLNQSGSRDLRLLRAKSPRNAQYLQRQIVFFKDTTSFSRRVNRRKLNPFQKASLGEDKELRALGSRIRFSRTPANELRLSAPKQQRDLVQIRRIPGALNILKTNAVRSSENHFRTSHLDDDLRKTGLLVQKELEVKYEEKLYQVSDQFELASKRFNEIKNFGYAKKVKSLPSILQYRTASQRISFFRWKHLATVPDRAHVFRKNSPINRLCLERFLERKALAYKKKTVEFGTLLEYTLTKEQETKTGDDLKAAIKDAQFRNRIRKSAELKLTSPTLLLGTGALQLSRAELSSSLPQTNSLNSRALEVRTSTSLDIKTEKRLKQKNFSVQFRTARAVGKRWTAHYKHALEKEGRHIFNERRGEFWELLTSRYFIKGRVLKNWTKEIKRYLIRSNWKEIPEVIYKERRARLRLFEWHESDEHFFREGWKNAFQLYPSERALAPWLQPLRRRRTAYNTAHGEYRRYAFPREQKRLKARQYYRKARASTEDHRKYVKGRRWPRLRTTAYRRQRSLFEFRNTHSAQTHFKKLSKYKTKTTGFSRNTVGLSNRLDVNLRLLNLFATVFWARRFAGYGLVLVNTIKISQANYRFLPGDKLEFKWEKIKRAQAIFNPHPSYHSRDNKYRHRKLQEIPGNYSWHSNHRLLTFNNLVTPEDVPDSSRLCRWLFDCFRRDAGIGRR